jgi:hypothetical protein
MQLFFARVCCLSVKKPWEVVLEVAVSPIRAGIEQKTKRMYKETPIFRTTRPVGIDGANHRIAAMR